MSHQSPIYGMSHGRMNKRLQLIAKVLKEYRAAGKVIEDLEEEYDCTIIYGKVGYGIQDIEFQNDSAETLFMLKYNT